jgi:hypothetical protein
MFTEKVCRNQLNYGPKVCGGRTNIKMLYFYAADSGKRLLSQVKSLTKTRKSIVLFGIGLHSKLDDTKVIQEYIQPTVDAVQRGNTPRWPHLAWLSIHAPGLLKSPLLVSQKSKSVKRYNGKIETFLEKREIPVLNFYNLTEGTVSFDGSHYGFGINLAKVQIILNYLHELQQSGRW